MLPGEEQARICCQIRRPESLPPGAPFHKILQKLQEFTSGVHLVPFKIYHVKTRDFDNFVSSNDNVYSCFPGYLTVTMRPRTQVPGYHIERSIARKLAIK